MNLQYFVDEFHCIQNNKHYLPDHKQRLVNLLDKAGDHLDETDCFKFYAYVLKVTHTNNHVSHSTWIIWLTKILIKNFTK